MSTKIKKFSAFGLIEISIAILVFIILSTFTYVVFNPSTRINDANTSRALVELKEISRALQLYSLDNGSYPPDAPRGVDPGLAAYLKTEVNWSQGPIPGTVYDYDNWIGSSCIDSDVNDTVQITLREIPDRNPDGSDVWAWYVSATPGKLGGPHCNDPDQWNKGECVSCADFDIANPPT